MTLAQQLGLRHGDDPSRKDYYLSLRVATREQRANGDFHSARNICSRFLMQMALNRTRTV